MVRQPGQRIRRYTLKQRLGAGGMGEVWLASLAGPHGFDHNVCIKTMLPEAARYLEAFATEARLGGRLNHANLVNVIDFFVEDGEHFAVMEYVEGLDLAELLERAGPLAPEMAAYVAWSALKGLHFAHTAALGAPGRGNVVHRDISPGNILVSNDAEVKVTDFGIAQLEVESGGKIRGPLFRGKPAYVSPEYLRLLELDARSDIYQIGVVLYEALAGVQPFADAESPYAMQLMIDRGGERPLRDVNPNVSRALAAATHQLMHHDRDQRPPTAEAARELIRHACPELLDAEAPLARLVL
jgi:serine/threonine-protein kinase